jgi:hypothetical protein
MTLTEKQEDEVRKKVIEIFGEPFVKELDLKFFEFNDLRLTCKDNYEFLTKIREKYKDEDACSVLAACLYGMKLGELGREYAYRQENAKKFVAVSGHAS